MIMSPGSYNNTHALIILFLGAGQRLRARECTNCIIIRDMEERLSECLGRLGFTGRVSPIPQELLANEKVNKFLSWVIQHLTPANLLSPSDIAR